MADTAERPLAGTEETHARYGTPTVVSYHVNGPLDRDLLDTAVRLLPRHHPVLTAHISHPPRGPMLRATNRPAPALDVNLDTDQATRLFTDEEPLFRPTLQPHGPTQHTLYLAVHHAVSDGASVLALHRLLWNIYTHLVTGETWTPPEPDHVLPDPIEPRFTTNITEKHLSDYISRTSSPQPGTEIPPDTDTAENGLHHHHLTIPPNEAATLTNTARKHGLGTNALLFGALAAAARHHITPHHRPLPVTYPLPIDLRPFTEPPTPDDHMCAAIATTYPQVHATIRDTPAELGKSLWDSVSATIANNEFRYELAGFSDLWKRHQQHRPTLLISSLLGRCRSLPLPDELSTAEPSFPVEPPTTCPAVGIGNAPDGTIGLDVLHRRRHYTREHARRFAHTVREHVQNATAEAQEEL
ncbi:hypothetical protein FHR84_000800 [Actinopolyspora biskrensis]|uniref:Phthiocerol/phthiodiolone dimycocerosyl transferase n=1 Tax=Actinopolyspora biskrensis TaxID=1470178 RepID=A0A852Z1G7_9ACTN|nr:condensation domain-containing protein [Actinopolyspora biskrensis]NYH77486.1 hypothetical protein [Actinopolyspora biskrensis]